MGAVVIRARRRVQAYKALACGDFVQSASIRSAPVRIHIGAADLTEASRLTSQKPLDSRIDVVLPR